MRASQQPIMIFTIWGTNETIEKRAASMRADRSSDAQTVSASCQHEHSRQASPKVVLAEMRARQRARIRELGDALVGAGLVALDEQAKALGLPRSTTWTILKGNHKGSGLSANIINRMFLSPRLPPPVRAKLLEYVDEKAAGLYGDSKVGCRKFSTRLALNNLKSVRALVTERQNGQPLLRFRQRTERRP